MESLTQQVEGITFDELDGQFEDINNRIDNLSTDTLDSLYQADVNVTNRFAQLNRSLGLTVFGLETALGNHEEYILNLDKNIFPIDSSQVYDRVSDKLLNDIIGDFKSLTNALNISPENTGSYRNISPYRNISNAIYNVVINDIVPGDNNYACSYYYVTPGTSYKVSGSTAENADSNPLGAFYNTNNVLLQKIGTTPTTDYNDYEVTAPNGASYLIVNKTSSSSNILVKRLIPSSGFAALDNLNYSLVDLKSYVDETQSSIYSQMYLTQDLLGENYDSTKSYNVDDYVVYNGNLYICMTKTEENEAFNTQKWKQVTFSDALANLNNKIETNSVISGNLTDRIKESLLECFKYVAWINDQGQYYYDKLDAALYGKDIYNINGWFYQFDDSVRSQGIHDFEFRGTKNYSYNGVNGKAYFHEVTAEGDSSTDIYGLYAVGISDIPDFSGDFTVSAWHRSITKLRGHVFTATKYKSGSSTCLPLTMVESTWANSTYSSMTNTNQGVKIAYASQKLQVMLFFTDDTCLVAELTLPSSIDTTEWHHHALTRNNGTIRYFFDGNLIFTAAIDKPVIFPNQVCLGNNFGTSASTASSLAQGSYSDYIDDLFVAEYSKWDAAFDITNIDYSSDNIVPEDPTPGGDPDPIVDPDPQPSIDIISSGWYYTFDDTLLSSGSHDFGFTGVTNYSSDAISGKSYQHLVATEGQKSTDVLGIAATGITDIPDFSGDFTVSAWHKSITNKRGHVFAATKYASGSSTCMSITMEDSAWSNTSHGSMTNINSGVKIAYSDQKLEVMVYFTDNTCVHSTLTLPSSVDTTTWHHHAITRKDGIIRYFFDGNLVWSADCDKDVIFPNQVCLGNNFGTTQGTATEVASGSYGDYIDDLFVAEYAKWDSNFDTSDIDYNDQTNNSGENNGDNGENSGENGEGAETS